MSKRYGWRVVRESCNDFELKLDDLFHFSYQSWGKNDWRCALMHRDHHVGAWLAFKRGKWVMQWTNTEWTQKGIAHPLDVVAFLNTHQDSRRALKAYQKDMLRKYCRNVSAYIRKLDKQIKITIPMDLKESKARLLVLEKMLGAL